MSSTTLDHHCGIFGNTIGNPRVLRDSGRYMFVKIAAIAHPGECCAVCRKPANVAHDGATFLWRFGWDGEDGPNVHPIRVCSVTCWRQYTGLDRKVKGKRTCREQSASVKGTTRRGGRSTGTTFRGAEARPTATRTTAGGR